MVTKHWTETKRAVVQYDGVPVRWAAKCAYCDFYKCDPLRWLRPLMREHVQVKHHIKA